MKTTSVPLLLTSLALACVLGCGEDSPLPPSQPLAEAQTGESDSSPPDAPARDYNRDSTPPYPETVPADAASDPAPAATNADAAPAFTAERLEQMVAPIALYPDALLMEVLMAATYPAEVAEAAAFVKANPNLNGKALDDAIADKNWDVSVNSLTHATDAVKLMGEDPAWVKDLGDAFLAQQDDVLNAVQVMRNRACDLGNLKDSDKQKVVFEDAPAKTAQPQQSPPAGDPNADYQPPPSGGYTGGGGYATGGGYAGGGYATGGGYIGGGYGFVIPPPVRIVRIVPVVPTMLYVPVYNPRVIFGPPPPVIFYPRIYAPSVYVSVGVAPVISFGVGFTVGSLFFGDLDWHHRRIYRHRYGGGYYSGDHWHRANYYRHADVWRHDRHHRRGISYARPDIVERRFREGDWARDRDGRYRDGRDRDGRYDGRDRDGRHRDGRFDGSRDRDGDRASKDLRPGGGDRTKGGRPGDDRMRGGGGRDDKRPDHHKMEQGRGGSKDARDKQQARPGGGGKDTRDKQQARPGGGSHKDQQMHRPSNRQNYGGARPGSNMRTPSTDRGKGSDKGSSIQRGGGPSKGQSVQRGPSSSRGGSSKGSSVQRGGGGGQSKGQSMQRGGGGSSKGQSMQRGGGGGGSSKGGGSSRGGGGGGKGGGGKGDGKGKN